MMMLEIDFLYEVGIELWSVMVSNVDKEALKTELQRNLLTPTSSLCQLLGGLYIKNIKIGLTLLLQRKTLRHHCQSKSNSLSRSCCYNV